MHCIRAESRFHDFCTELLQCDCDIFLFNETRRHDREEHFILPFMDRIQLSGGNMNLGHCKIRQDDETNLECFLTYLFPTSMFVEVDVFWAYIFLFVMLLANLLG